MVHVWFFRMSADDCEGLTNCKTWLILIWHNSGVQISRAILLTKCFYTLSIQLYFSLVQKDGMFLKAILLAVIISLV